MFCFSYEFICIKIIKEVLKGGSDMSKKNSFGKFVLFTAAVGAAAAGAYYYLTKREDELADDFGDEDFDDFDDFEDDEAASDSRMSSRKYVDITEGKTADKKEDAADTAAADTSGDVDEEEEEEDTPDKSEEFFDDEA